MDGLDVRLSHIPAMSARILLSTASGGWCGAALVLAGRAYCSALFREVGNVM